MTEVNESVGKWSVGRWVSGKCSVVLIKPIVQTPDSVFSNVYVLILEQLIGAKNIIFSLFLRPVTNTFQIIYNTHFPDHFLIAAYYYEIGRCKIFTNAIKILPKPLHIFQ